MQRVLCNAIVDEEQPPAKDGKGLGKYRVEVWGRPPHDYVRIYQIQAASDTLAAQEGLRRFVAEMEAKFQE
jgi:hypothetical protein